MAATRNSEEPKSSPAPKAGTKRPTEDSTAPPAKRGRGRPKKIQKTPEKTTGGAEDTVMGNGIEDDKEVAKQIGQDDTSSQPVSSQPAKRGRGRPKKVQKTIEETTGAVKDNKSDLNTEDPEKAQKTAEGTNGAAQGKENKTDEKTPEQVSGGAVKKQVNEASESNKGESNGEKSALDEVKADTDDVKNAVEKEQESMSKEVEKTTDSIIEGDKREAAIPSSILEKGIIYFFFRGRVNVEEPQGIDDVARSYIVLRPLPLSAKIGEGPLEDSGNARLLALPKKMLPKSRRDRFLVFVEQPNATIKDLRGHFASNEYATKTSGTSHTPAATPFAEGVYAITSTGRESHLAYHVTVPEIGEIQKELGLNEKGSYIVSVKNPNTPGPANATLSNPAEYPESIQKKFRGLRWMPLEPELLDYQNTQFLMIGEGLGDLGKAVEETSRDAKDDEKEKPVEEIEALEKEDHDRVEHLKQDDPIFADLGLSSKENSKMQTTW